MSLRLEAALAVALLVVVSCSGDPSTDSVESLSPGVGASSPTEAVTELVTAINVPDFSGASRLAMPGHAALASLAEGATFGDVAEAIREGDQAVAANFWAGFAQGAGSFLGGDVNVNDAGTVSRDGVEFHQVSVATEDGGTRSVLIRESDGYRIDLFASFGAGLADKMMGPVERLINTQSEDARLILANLREIVPSLLVASELPGTATDVSQQVLALVEVITRIG
ncbi:MAG TPA: hypothetical protein VFZ80_04315 [Acidimicrobiia bacterium]